MPEYVRKQLPVIAAVFAIGILTSAFALLQLRGSVPGISVDTFSLFSLIIPCVAALLCSLVIMLMASEIGKQLFVIVTSICVIAGAISMIAVSIWMSDQTFAAQLLAQSAEGAQVVPPINAPLIIVRNIAAFFVCSVVGSIVGAWVGSRLHPVRATGNRTKGSTRR